MYSLWLFYIRGLSTYFEFWHARQSTIHIKEDVERPSSYRFVRFLIKEQAQPIHLSLHCHRIKEKSGYDSLYLSDVQRITNILFTLLVIVFFIILFSIGLVGLPLVLDMFDGESRRRVGQINTKPAQRGVGNAPRLDWLVLSTWLST